MYGCVFYYYYLLCFAPSFVRSYVRSFGLGGRDERTFINILSQSVSQSVEIFSAHKKRKWCAFCVFYHFYTHIMSLNVISVLFCFACSEWINMQKLNNSGCIIWYNFAIQSCHIQESQTLVKLTKFNQRWSIYGLPHSGNSVPASVCLSFFSSLCFVLYTNCLCWRLSSSPKSPF